MAFTNPWDEAFPPDSQPANLLGNDIRRLRLDVRERMMAFSSGPFADRPAPEAVFGNGNDGVMYFSTDTHQVFRWNGAAWVDITNSISSSILDNQGILFPIVGNNTDLSVFSSPLIGPFAAGQGFRIRLWFLHNAGLGSVTYKLFYGLTVLETFSYAPKDNIGYDFFEYTVINNLGVQNAQVVARHGIINFAGQAFNQTPSAYAATTAANMAVAGVVKFTMNAPSTESIIPKKWIIELVR